MNSYPSYSVAIRTLGTAGDKYVAEIHSVYNQTIKPDGVYVYIPDGYDAPSVLDETYKRSPKGMVHQRSLPFDEIESDYILFLDDDVFLPQDSVETLFRAMLDNGADCIAPVLYDNHKMSFLKKITSSVFAGTYPSFDSKWAFKIRKDSHFSYCNNPSEIMLTQSASFACFLCKKQSYKKIHFEDERWIDSNIVAFGDDQLFFYKMYKYGYKLLVHYNTGITHLDAKSSRTIGRGQLDYAFRFIRFVIWYRTIYESADSMLEKVCSVASYCLDVLRSFVSGLLYVIIGRFYALPNIVKATINGLRFVNSREYESIPKFMAHK